MKNYALIMQKICKEIVRHSK